jgi:hypothetical protein
LKSQDDLEKHPTSLLERISLNGEFLSSGSNIVPFGRECSPGRGTIKVLAVSSDGQTASIQSFNISRQKFVGKPLIGIPSSALLPWKEDASQAAARIVREATENK